MAPCLIGKGRLSEKLKSSLNKCSVSNIKVPRKYDEDKQFEAGCFSILFIRQITPPGFCYSEAKFKLLKVTVMVKLVVHIIIYFTFLKYP